MKKYIILFCVFLFISFSLNSISAIANPDPKAYSEGIYKINDLKLMPNVLYKAQNVSSGQVFMIIMDSNQLIQQFIRFEPNSIQYSLRPIQYDYKIVILGTGQLSFTT